MEFEEKTELKWLNEIIKKIERGLLQAENVDLPETKRTIIRIEEIIAADKKKLDELKAKRIRLLAVMDEKEKAGE